MHWVHYLDQKSGFRPQVVLELEQIAVAPRLHGRGVGRKADRQVVPDVKQVLQGQSANLKHIMVTTRADNHAQALYKSVLDAEIEAVISSFYSADEVIMIARDVGRLASSN